ncbi:P-type ATPase [Marssonina coronariae]|uniref:P-type ATPase n=1 Tax=Diplocarpon coronariae TaxID=2795749 RepID=A0A218Z8X0_9HELO|nr:P-type ATPase [Marssonina coronariae]
MRKGNVVIRDLSALEALGGVTNICSDKTGTLTQSAMIVKVWLPKVGILTVNKSTDPNNPTQGEVVVDSEAISQLSDLDYSDEKPDFDHQRSTAGLKFDVPAGKLAKDQHKNREPSEQPAIINDDLEAFLRPTALYNLATVKEEQAEGEDSKKWRTIGEPTEIALEVFIAEFPFDSSIKRMSVVYKNPGSRKSMVYTKGAVERVLDLCSSISVGASNEPMTDLAKQDCLTCMEHFARHGQRFSGFASKTWDGAFPEQHGRNVDSLRPEVEDNLTLVGLVGIYDPPPDETKAAVRECSEAGIRVHMPTEDHPATAEAIAKEIGIVLRNMGVLPKDVAVSLIFKATDFDKPTDAEINVLPEFPLVIARCAPDTKTRMIEALRRRGLFIEMTGDGVNDVSSPSSADVGIAIGLAGSDVAKEAAKIVLTDDKFTSTVSAIREGCRMFDNIQKIILHLLKSNIGEVILLIAGQHAYFLVPAFGLGRERPSSETMRRPPRKIRYGVFTPQIMADIVVYGMIMGTCTILTFAIIVYGVYDGRLGPECNARYNTDTYESLTVSSSGPSSSAPYPSSPQSTSPTSTPASSNTPASYRSRRCLPAPSSSLSSASRHGRLPSDTGAFEAGSDDDLEHCRTRKLGLRQGFFTKVKSQASSIRSISRRGTNRSSLSVNEKVAHVGTLSSAPTTRSLLQSDKAPLDSTLHPRLTVGHESV